MRASALASAKNSVSITTHRLDHLLMTVSKPPREMASQALLRCGVQYRTWFTVTAKIRSPFVRSSFVIMGSGYF